MTAELQFLPRQTEAHSAAKQPCRGLVRQAHPDDEPSRGLAADFQKHHIGSVDPDALKIPAATAEYSLPERPLSPLQAEPTQNHNEKPPALHPLDWGKDRRFLSDSQPLSRYRSN